MKVNFIKTKEFKLKIAISIVLLILFSLSFLFANQIQTTFGLVKDHLNGEVKEATIENTNYKVHYLDVGQGNCTVAELPDGKTLIIDGGSDFYGEKIYEFLKEKNISTIDFMIATHADADHIGGLNFLFDKFEIVNIFRPMQIAGTKITETSSSGSQSSRFEVYEEEDLKFAYSLYGSGAFVEVTSQRYREFISNVYAETYTLDGETKQSEVTVFYDGLKISGENYEISFYAPLKLSEEINFASVSNTNGFMTKIYSSDSSNASSAVFILEIFDDKYFFSGDASAPHGTISDESKFEETDFLKSLTEDEIYELLSVDVYLVAHHGSMYSSSSKLLNVILPKFAVVSVGKNSYGHPSNEVILRLENLHSLNDDGILKTCDVGNITFSNLDGKIVFAVEKTTKHYKLLIPFEILMIIVFVLLECIVINVRPCKKKQLTADKKI